ncbi:hypothetical protein [Actinoplanes sp. HUAS TT8]|uniref:hypothetical protein n=1 Tax=Actinoplanes sp. HUAS TT8 TaxID=3447453 RepID=UPI003F528206
MVAVVIYAFKSAMLWTKVYHPLLLVVVFAAVVAVWTTTVYANRYRHRRRMLQRAAAAGRRPLHVPGLKWSWGGLLHQGKTQVEAAWTAVVDGFPMIVGRVSRSGDWRWS